MCPRHVSADVGEVQILGDQEAIHRLCRLPDFVVGPSCQVLRPDSVDLMPEFGKFGQQPLGKILVELDLHRLIGNSAKGRSS